MEGWPRPSKGAKKNIAKNARTSWAEEKPEERREARGRKREPKESWDLGSEKKEALTQRKTPRGYNCRKKGKGKSREEGPESKLPLFDGRQLSLSPVKKKRKAREGNEKKGKKKV